jgi:hypothetical protein
MFNNRQPNVGSQRPPQDKYERFEVWLKENGAQFDLVSHFIGISPALACKLSGFFSRQATDSIAWSWIFIAGTAGV